MLVVLFCPSPGASKAGYSSMHRSHAYFGLPSVLDGAEYGVDDARLIVSDPGDDDWQVFLAVPSLFNQRPTIARGSGRAHVSKRRTVRCWRTLSLTQSCR